jgi:hypothetical protein
MSFTRQILLTLPSPPLGRASQLLPPAARLTKPWLWRHKLHPTKRIAKD